MQVIRSTDVKSVHFIEKSVELPAIIIHHVLYHRKANQFVHIDRGIDYFPVYLRLVVCYEII